MKEKDIKATRAANYCCYPCSEPEHSAKGVKCGGQGNGQKSSPSAPVPDARHGVAASQKNGYIFLICTKMNNGVAMALLGPI